MTSSDVLLRLALTGLAAACLAQDAHLLGPTMGLVFDPPTRSLRQVAGMPGAARLADTVVADLDWASAAPNGRLAVLVRQGETRVYSLTNPTQDPAGTIVDGLIEAPQFSAWAADSSAVALYSPTGRAAQWVHFNGTSASADSPLSLTGVDGEVTALSADPVSGLMTFAVAGAGVFRLSASEGPTLVLAVADPSAIALEPGGKTLWVADRANAQLVQVASPGTDAVTQTVLADTEKLNDISALGFSSNRKTLYLANHSTLRLYSFDRAGASLSDGIALDAPASSLTPVGRPSLFLLNQRGKLGAPLYVLDEAAGLNIKFIPADEVR